MKSFTTELEIQAVNRVNEIWNEFAPNVADLLNSFSKQQFKQDGSMTKALRSEFLKIVPNQLRHAFLRCNGQVVLEIEVCYADEKECHYKRVSGMLRGLYDEKAEAETGRKVDFKKEEYFKAVDAFRELHKQAYELEFKHAQFCY